MEIENNFNSLITPRTQLPDPLIANAIANAKLDNIPQIQSHR
jgi:hypothetical protein